MRKGASRRTNACYWPWPAGWASPPWTVVRSL